MLGAVPNYYARESEANVAKVDEKVLTSISVPADVVDAAKKVGMDLEDLGRLCVSHTVDAARDFLNWALGKLPAKN